MSEVTMSKAELWINQAPSLNFEYGEDELLQKALEHDFVREIGKDLYLVNTTYRMSGYHNLFNANLV